MPGFPITGRSLRSYFHKTVIENQKLKITYVANARIPTEKAHGFQIMKMCESFARAGAEVQLVLPRRKNAGMKPADPFEFYGISRFFPVKTLFTPDPSWLIASAKPGIYIKVQAGFFFVSLFFYLLFGNDKKDAIVYTRDAALLPLLTKFSGRVVWEGHILPAHLDHYLRFFRRCRKIITVTGLAKDQLVACGIDSKNILVAHDGVDLDVFDVDCSRKRARETLNLPAKKKILGYTGSFKTYNKNKGISEILRALPLLKAPTGDFLFIAVGGSGADIKEYAREAAALGVSERVLLLPRVEQKKLALYQKACDILLMPFPNAEHYAKFMSPLKMFEYMASRRPIIASRLPSITEVLSDKSAVLVSPGDPAALAAAAERLLQDEDLGEQLARQAFGDAQNYTWAKRAEDIIKALA